jgi:hypothetical protein
MSINSVPALVSGGGIKHEYGAWHVRKKVPKALEAVQHASKPRDSWLKQTLATKDLSADDRSVGDRPYRRYLGQRGAGNTQSQAYSGAARHANTPKRVKRHRIIVQRTRFIKS